MIKPLTKSQTELLQLKQALANQEIQRLVIQIAEELGIDPQENWKLSPDFKSFSKPDDPTAEKA